MKSALKVSFVVLVLALAVVGQVASHTPTIAKASLTARPVATVNGKVITDRDLLRQMLQMFPYSRQHGGRFPKDKEPEIRRNALNQLEFEELVYQEAQRRKMTITPVRMDKAVRDFKKQFASAAEFNSYLAQEHGTMANLRDKIRRAILIEDLLKKEITSKTKLTPAQLTEIYNKNPERFRKPDSVSIQTISVAAPEGASAADRSKAKERAQKLLAEAKSAKDYEAFGVLAEKNSEDEWRVMMGDHRWLHRGRMPPEIEKVVFEMKAGQVSDVIETQDSFCIVRVNAIEKSKMVPFAEIKTKLKTDLETQKSEELRKALEAKLRSGAKLAEL